jgi:hypothetical protein
MGSSLRLQLEASIHYDVYSTNHVPTSGTSIGELQLVGQHCGL